MRKLGFILMAVCVIGFAAPAISAEFQFHGDLNHRFMLHTNHAEWFAGPGETVRDEPRGGRLNDGDVDDQWAEVKYRLWFEAATDDGAVKGVVATEIGSLDFGRPARLDYSGDDIVFEFRWGYVDFQVPGIDHSSRLRIGLQPISVNPYLWQENVAGVNWFGSSGILDYQLAWFRGHDNGIDWDDDEDDAHEDVDAFLGRLNYKPDDNLDAGFFVLYQNNDGEDTKDAPISARKYEVKFFNDVKFDLLTFGLDGSYKMNDFFFNYDLMYQDGEMEGSFAGLADDYDVQAWFGHLDAGINFGNHKLTYTFWYASGDDDADDDDFDAFITTDTDIFDSIVFFEGGYTDDDYYTEKPYILDKGMIFNKLALDSKITDKLTVGAAVLYLMTAEDIEYTDNNGRDQDDDELGWEIDAYFKYMLYSNLEFSVNAGYLFSGDAMDSFEEECDGSDDEDIFASTARIRYKF
jgi:hypothetical protein